MHKLLAESSSHVLGSLDSSSVLNRAAVQVSHALANRTPSKALVGLGNDCVGRGLVGKGGLVVQDELAAKLVGHAGNLGALEAAGGLVADNSQLVSLAGLGSALGVVGGEHEVGGGEPGARGVFRELLVDELMGDGVVALVSVLLGVMNKTSLLVFNVSAADELDAQLPAFLGGEGNVTVSIGAGALEVSLNGVVDECVAVGVESSHELDCPLIYAVLDGLLLSVEPNTRSLLLGLCAELSESVVDYLGHWLLSLKSVNSNGPGTSDPVSQTMLVMSFKLDVMKLYETYFIAKTSPASSMWRDLREFCFQDSTMS